MIRAALILAFVGGVAAVSAQAPAPAPSAAAFEVASVKRSPPSVTDSIVSRPGAFLPGGRFVASNATLRIIIHRAYPEYTDRPDRIIGPDWIDRERFDIDAKADGDPPISEIRIMLRRLLAERFNLRVHAETRQGDAYALVPTRTDGMLGSGLRPTATDCSSLSQASPTAHRKALPSCSLHLGFENGLRTYSIRGGSMFTLTTVLQMATGRAVEDRTALSGSFDVDLEWDPDNALRVAADINVRPTIFTAVQEQLGLKLEPARGPVEVLVIDSVEMPTPN